MNDYYNWKMQHKNHKHNITSTRITPFIFKKLLADYLYENIWIILLFTFVILFTLPVEMVVLPRFYSQLFEKMRTTKASSLPQLFENIITNITSFSSSGLIYIISVIWLVVVCAYLIKNTLYAYIVPSYTSFIRQKMFAGTVHTHSDDYKDLRVGEHVTRLMDVSRNMKDLLTWTLNDILPLYIAIVCLCVFLFFTNWKIGLVTTIGIIIHSIALYFTLNESIKISAKRETHFLDMGEKIHDSFGNLMNVYINNMKTSEIKSNNNTETEYRQLYQNQYTHIRNVIAILSFITILTFIITVLVTYNELKSQTINNVAFISVWIILLLYLSNMMRLSDFIPHFTTKFGIVACSNDFLVNILKPSAHRHSKEKIKHGAIQFKNIEFTYDGNEYPTLYDLNLDIQPQEKIAILGTSGSGKTTAMKLLNGIHVAQKGTILIDDIDINTIPLDYVRKQVNYINQRTSLFNKNIIENIQYGNQATSEHIQTILQDYGLSSVFSKLKQGIYTNAGVHGGSLSLGMQKITILLRGLLRGGKVIVLDEPLAGLDSTTRTNIMRFIKDMCTDKTLIVITHDKEILPMVDRVVEFGDINHTYKFVPEESKSITEQFTNLFNYLN